MITTPSQFLKMMKDAGSKNVDETNILELMLMIRRDTENKKYKMENENIEGQEKFYSKCVRTEKKKNGCGEWKPITEFSINLGSPGETVRTQSYCKTCNKLNNAKKKGLLEQENILETEEHEDQVEKIAEITENVQTFNDQIIKELETAKTSLENSLTVINNAMLKLEQGCIEE